MGSNPSASALVTYGLAPRGDHGPTLGPRAASLWLPGGPPPGARRHHAGISPAKPHAILPMISAASVDLKTYWENP